MSIRIPWSKNGSYLYSYNKGNDVKTLLTSANAAVLDGDTSLTDWVQSPTHYFMINFPTPVTITKIGTRTTGEHDWVSFTQTFSYATESNVMGTGVFTDITTVETPTQWWDRAYREFTFANPPSGVRWLRIYFPAVVGYQISGAGNTLHLFGSYDDPDIRWRFFNDEMDTELNVGEYPISFPVIGNRVDTTETIRFRLKNTDIANHSYRVTVSKVHYTADTVLTDHVKLSYPTYNSGTPSTSVDTNSINAGDFSNTISIVASYPPNHNPGDGKHYFAIEVKEIT